MMGNGFAFLLAFETCFVVDMIERKKYHVPISLSLLFWTGVFDLSVSCALSHSMTLKNPIL